MARRRDRCNCPGGLLEGPGDLGAPMNAQLLQKVVHVVLDGRHLDAEATGYFLVREVVLEQGDDLAFALREPRRAKSLPRAGRKASSSSVTREKGKYRTRIYSDVREIEGQKFWPRGVPKGP